MLARGSEIEHTIDFPSGSVLPSSAAPQVGQGTDKICFRESSLGFRARIHANVPQAGKCSILLIFNTLANQQVSLGFAQRFLPICEQK
jgi:hypothetical protein